MDEDRDYQIAAWKRKARVAAKKRNKRNLYVITLHPQVLTCRDFRNANPAYIEGMPCVYVGITIHDPGDRYRQHKSGYKCCKYARKFGVELALDLIDGFDEAGLSEQQREPALAAWLRGQGYAVWQN